MQRFEGLFNTVRPARGFEDIVAQIQQAIVDGRLSPGDKLPNERELGGVFGVSRPTLREAIRVLEATGVVEVRRGTSGGTFVVEPNPDLVSTALEALIRFRGATVEDLAEFRANFEAETAHWAALRATAQQSDGLLAIADKVMRAVDETTTTWRGIVDLDLSFHELVADSSQNQIRVAIMLAIHGVLHKTSLIIGNVDSPEWRRQQAQDLQRIAEAISTHDAKLAREMMLSHVTRNVQVGVAQQHHNP